VNKRSAERLVAKRAAEFLDSDRGLRGCPKHVEDPNLDCPDCDRVWEAATKLARELYIACGEVKP